MSFKTCFFNAGDANGNLQRMREIIFQPTTETIPRTTEPRRFSDTGPLERPGVLTASSNESQPRKRRHGTRKRFANKYYA